MFEVGEESLAVIVKGMGQFDEVFHLKMHLKSNPIPTLTLPLLACALQGMPG